MASADSVPEFDDEEPWDYYRASTFAKDIRDFLEALAPGCVETSRCGRMSIHRPTWCSRSLPGFEGYHEVRTHHFATDMPREQRTALNQGLHHNPRRQINTRVQPTEPIPWPGHKEWCWLPGFRVFEGRRTVALRVIINWRTPEIEAKYKEMHSELQRRVVPCKDDRPHDLQLLQALEDAGPLGCESYHCHFGRQAL